MTSQFRDSLKKTRVGKAIRFAKGMWPLLAGTAGGLYDYRTRGGISHTNWEKLLSAHCTTNGRATSLLESAMRIMRAPPKAEPATGLLGHFSLEDQKAIVSTLQRDGVYVFPARLAEVFCDQIYAFAVTANTVIESNRDLKAPLVPFDPTHPVSRTYKIREQDAIANPAVQMLLADPAFLGIAQAYLKTLPAISGIDVWWSARYGNEPGSDAAQLFHFDFDAPPIWLKLFVYLTDVGPDTGPHIYVKGSHRAGIASAEEFRSRGYQRIDDEEIVANFGKDALTEITGRKGTVFIADTRGFHKGKMPTSGHRLVAQLLYSSPLFCEHGAPAKMPQQVQPALAEAVRKAAHVYERFR